MRKLAFTLTAGAIAAASIFGAGSARAFTQSGKPVPAAASDVTQVAVQRQVPQKYKRKSVKLVTDERPGTIIVDTNNKFLYFVEGNNRATRYGIGVGREGFGWSGVVKVQRKAEWPGWTPPKEMIRREAAKGHILPEYQEGGIDNPLGARALYLYKGRNDSGFRIHGTNQPWSIGLNMSSGCIRMMNKDVEHLYDRTSLGAKVIVIGPGNRQGNVQFADQGVDYFRTLFSSLQ
ncbi:L,D-transpeptidase [Rhizobium sp. KVB221]|uniref:L,D-transpeptidase n=1 Tax=Rhizobium setariae TaxID=2801340 RepID=A0A937CIZ4_9HYPH|nr:L,D-transpeptidase [Rhizobium setariae]MBL0370565.1 L,D-transpeptidase [Rhizobium setariae]